MSHYFKVGVIPAYLLLCLVLGGASAAGFWANMMLQLIGIVIILWSLQVDRHTPMPAASRRLIVILALILLVVAVQLVPLPPGVWTALPGRDGIAEGFALLGQPLPWMPLSLAPYETWASALWLIPAIAVLLGILRLGNFKASWIAWAIAVVTVAGVMIGALQITSGDTRSSPWYFYEITNYGIATGFFSNANHMATLLVATIPFLAALYLTGRSKARSTHSSSAMFVILVGVMTVIVVGIAINQSLAVIGLAAPVIGASLLMLRSAKSKLPRWWAAGIGLLAILSIAAVFSAPLGNNLTSDDAATSPFSRYTSFTTTLKAAGDYGLLGSGVGTFDQIYPGYEEPTTVTRTYINHAHSDYIELWLETGLLGAAVLLVFLAWWASRAIAIWRAETPDYYAMAATIASFAIIAHSVVDYPLRTAAISALFAACCALMADPRARVRQRERQRPENRARHLSAD